jgi:hypothetical protein
MKILRAPPNSPIDNHKITMASTVDVVCGGSYVGEYGTSPHAILRLDPLARATNF